MPSSPRQWNMFDKKTVEGMSNLSIILEGGCHMFPFPLQLGCPRRGWAGGSSLSHWSRESFRCGWHSVLRRRILSVNEASEHRALGEKRDFGAGQGCGGKRCFIVESFVVYCIRVSPSSAVFRCQYRKPGWF